MKLIIDIDEETYNRAKNEPSILCGMNDGLIYQSNMKEAIANGKPYNPTGYLTEAEKKICKMYLEDLDKTHTCNEYTLLMNLIDIEMPNWYKVYEDVKSTFERPQGEWVYDSNHSITIDMYKCSVCGGYGHTHFNFCPNCGADMRKGDTE